MAVPEELDPALPGVMFGFGLIRKGLMVLIDNIFSPLQHSLIFLLTSYSSFLSSFRSLTHKPGVFVGECSACAIREQQVWCEFNKKAIFSPSASGLETIILQGDVLLTSIDFSSVCVCVCIWRTTK